MWHDLGNAGQGHLWKTRTVGLESRCGLRVTVGSNPTPSASGAERIGRFVQPTLGNLVADYQLNSLAPRQR